MHPFEVLCQNMPWRLKKLMKSFFNAHIFVILFKWFIGYLVLLLQLHRLLLGKDLMLNGFISYVEYCIATILLPF
jgi:hypothetical protein